MNKPAAALPPARHNHAHWKGLSILLLIATADLLMFGQNLGLNIWLFANLTSLMLILCARKRMTMKMATGFAALNVLLSAPLLETPTWMGIVVAITGLILTALAAAGLLPNNPFRWPGLLDRFLLAVPARPFVAFSRWKQPVRSNAVVTGLSRHIRAWFLPLLLSAAFLALFAAANPLIERTIEKIDLAFFLQLLDPQRMGFWLTVGAFTALLLFPRLRRRHRPQSQTPQAPSIDNHPLFGTAGLQRSLILFNALFAVETLLDLTYLWGGADLPSGMSHAEYAHRGAYPLIATALLAALFVLLAMRRGGPGEKSRFIRGLVYLWIGQNILLCLSSLLRLDLYVEVYSLTGWRVAAGIWMGLVAAGLLFILLRIKLNKTNEWLVAMCTLTLYVVLFLSASANIPGFIARFNVSHSLEVSGQGRPIDLYYIKRLGPAAIPAVVTFIETAQTNVKYADHVLKSIAHEQRRRDGDWRNWTFRDARLDAYLANPRAIARLIQRGQ